MSGADLCRAVLADLGLTRTTGGPPTTHCPTHPTEPGGTTPAGDAWCPTCRRACQGRNS